MRQNLPVSETEYQFPDGETLVSTTDLKGRILYCNPPFIRVSGYEKGELLGQPHNMIRHPDMPEEAFRDMWETIQGGKPWSALVKNRRKNGDFYWVLANVTPLMDGDAPTGFMSVRTKPTVQQVQGAEALYATMRAEKAAGVRVHRLAGGHLHRDHLFGRVAQALTFGLPVRMTGLVTTATAASFALGVVTSGGSWSASPLWLGAGIAGAAVAALAAGLRVRALTVLPMQQLLIAANRMAAGDLTQPIAAGRNDVVGRLSQALGQLNVNLMSIVRDARNEVQRIQGAASEITAGNQELSSRTESQASSLEETASSMEQITGTVRNSVDNARHATSLAKDAEGITHRSSAAVAQVSSTMQAISQSSGRIAEIIQVIDGISFQTNILALNAAVEAARAGEHGRGFAVVAAEVRALAQRTSVASREIKGLIEESAQRVHDGETQVASAGSTMQQAMDAVSQVSVLIGEISTGSAEQLNGISQVNSAVTQLDTITQQNAGMVEELAAAASALKDQAEIVAETVSVFKLDATPRQATRDAAALRKAAREAVVA